MAWRYLTIVFIFAVLYALLISNLYNLQFTQSAYFLARVQNQNRLSGSSEPPRGNIYFTDKNNNLIPAALNKDYDVIFAVPTEIQSNVIARRNIEKLSLIVNLSEEELEKKLSKKGDQYELLAQKASKEQISQIQELGFKGIYVDKQNLRFYPFEKLASHFLGFVSPANDKEIAGRYGLELQFNTFLKSGDLVLSTIDRNIQAAAEEILKGLIGNWQAEGGTIIVQEPKSGRILAMANSPDFDPNNYSKSELKNFLNPAVQAVYEFGSVLKIITMAAGIDSAKITPQTAYLDKGEVIIDGETIKNWGEKVYGQVNMTEVLEYSINTGSIFAERKIGHSNFYKYLVQFGFNELTGINLPGEVKGNLRNLKNGRDIDYATASFGQGISLTPIALINGFSAIANNGVLMKPLILTDEEPSPQRKVVASETAKAVVEMMISAVKKNKAADIPNYSIAGKSGTAYIPDFKKGGYTNEVINTYVGFGPVNNPKFTILIKLDKPIGAPFANQTTAPAFKELAQFILNYYNIAPDRL